MLCVLRLHGELALRAKGVLLLRESGMEVDVVVGLPRGGVAVAGEIARILQRSLDVIGVRKVGHPWRREFAVGALAENGVMVLDEQLMEDDLLVRTALEDVIKEESARLQEYREKFHRGKKTEFSGKSVLIVDDGLATGATVTTRKMQGPTGGLLNYALTQDAGHTINWGNTTGTWEAGTGNGAAQTITVYGQVAAGQTPPVGAYSDLITATVNY